ncbi:MAG: hypothetical protein WKF44_07340 [Rubrobacteraceae bacterium]
MERYGRDGSFWKARPSLPYRPITSVELGNEPNWGGYWCPTPEPETYAKYASAGADGAHAADPQIEAAIGGLVMMRINEIRNGVVHGMATDTFLSRMINAEPTLRDKVDSVALHLYNQDPDVNLSLLGWVRARMAELGLGSQNLYISEFGWGTKGGINFVSETTREANFRSFISKLSRTDCQVSALAPFTWYSQESDPGNPEHWFGLAAADGSPYPSGQAYIDEVATFEGSGTEPAVRNTLHVCGAPPPDQDGDGVPDESDDYPIDPDRSTGSGETPPPDPEQPVGPSRPPRLPADFFGVFAREMPWEADRRRSYYDSMQAIHLGVVRDTTLWNHAEPSQPTSPSGMPNWTETDPRVLGMARRGIRVQPTFIRPPDWISSVPSQAEAQFVAFLEAYAERYGRDGSFWAENGNLDRDLSVRDYEIWSDVDLNQGAWDGTASAAEYASTYSLAAAALTAVDPSARAVIPLHQSSRSGSAADFIRSMVLASPGLRGKIDSVYVEILQSSSPAEIESVVASMRSALNDTGNPTATIKAGIGWNTQGPSSVTETMRADLLAASADRLARSDCGVDAVIADSWTMAEQDQASAWDWLGIAERSDGALRPSGEAFGAVASSFLGYGEVPARSTVHACGLAAPDRDGDGTLDESDDFPIDPERFDGESPVITSSLNKSRSRVTVKFSATDQSALSNFECRLDNKAWTPCSSTLAIKRPRPGRHVLRIAVADEWGNRSEVSKRWKTSR